MITRADIVRDLKAYGTGDGPALGLAEAALLIAALGRPGLAMERYRRHLQTLAGKVAGYARAEVGPVPVAIQAEALAQVLARHYGYSAGLGDALDIDSFDLSRVIDARDGGGEALVILYTETARRLGWTAEVLAIPGRLLVRLDSEGERLILDPVAGGALVDAAEMRAIAKAASGLEAELSPAMMHGLDDRAVLLRLLGARKSMLLRARSLESAAVEIDCALLLAPGEPSLWRECGLLAARLERFHDAVTALEEYLRLGPGDAARYNTSILLQELRGRLT